MTAASAAALLRVEIDMVLADWACHLDHGELDALAERWRISERRIIPVFRDPARAPITA